MPSSPSSLPDDRTQRFSDAQAPLDNEELSRFRQEWLVELQQRKEPQGKTTNSSAPHGAIASGSGATTTTDAPTNRTTETEETSKAKQFQSPFRERAFREPVVPRRTNHPAVKDGALQNETHMPSSLVSALGIYRRAVKSEESGNLDEAIVLYRQAFRLHDNVDREYQREQMLKSIANDRDALIKHVEDEIAVDELSASFRSTVTIRASSKPAIVCGTLATILQSFPQEIKFEPEDEKQGVIFNSLPEEMVVLIISKLDPTSIERFACVCKKARMLTLDAGIWRDLVRRTYKPPQVPDLEIMLPVVEKLFFDFRRVYIEQPRVRLDGVYIAICHYVRPGLSENHWVSVTHLITYHRYLRFLPSGIVLSLLANEEKPPQEVIPILKPALRMKGLFIGHWKLVGTTIHISGLIDASGKFALPSLLGGGEDGVDGNKSTTGHAHSTQQPIEQARYTFDMTLSIRSRPLGRWNRMDMQSYDSLHLETGDVHPVALKHERPFWFSKVRSY